MDEAEFLRADVVVGDLVGDEGEGLCGAVAAEGDVEHVFCAGGGGGEGYDIDDVDPVGWWGWVSLFPAVLSV